MRENASGSRRRNRLIEFTYELFFSSFQEADVVQQRDAALCSVLGVFLLGLGALRRGLLEGLPEDPLVVRPCGQLLAPPVGRRVSFCTNGWDAQARRLCVETGCAAQGAWQAGGRVRCACLRCGALTGSAQRACGRLRCASRLEAARRTATATEQRLVRVCAGASNL